MKPPHLPVHGFDDPFDFYGVLFVHFQVDWSWQKCRYTLEELIRRAGGDAITPAWVEIAFFAQRQRITEGLPPWERERLVLQAWRARQMRLWSIGIVPGPIPAPKWKPNGGPLDPATWRQPPKPKPQPTPGAVLGAWDF